jgi:biopolymer transport protein ExbD
VSAIDIIERVPGSGFRALAVRLLGSLRYRPKAAFGAVSDNPMASIDTGSSRGKGRSTNHDLPLVPFVDFLLCLVVFLLAAGGFQGLARLESNARMPGQHDSLPEAPSKRLHVEVGEQRFRLSWRTGATVLVTNDVPLAPVVEADGNKRYPELARFLDRDWRENGVHRAPGDATLDEAVLHVRNSAPYEDVIAVLDALRSPRRALPGMPQASVFAVSFAAD